MGSVDDLRVFMEHHVFAVWDFMSLLKALQRELTCTEVPWVPRGDPVTRRLINDIVLGEESDVDGPHGAVSHFELYRRAMTEVGADTGAIDTLLALVREGIPVSEALDRSKAPAPAAAFVRTTWRILDSDSLPAIAAAFALGREDPIPEMFTALLADLPEAADVELKTFRYYLDRHIELDGDHHGNLSRRLLEIVCADDATKWEEATDAAREALTARAELWDGVLDALRPKGSRARLHDVHAGPAAVPARQP